MLKIVSPKVSLCLFSMFLVLPAIAQVNTAWVRRYNGVGNSGDQASALAIDPSSNVYVTGKTWIDTVYCNDVTTVKYSSGGAVLWAKRLDGTARGFNDDDQGNSIAVDVGSNAYVAGMVSDTITDSTKGYDYITVKYYPGGDSAWAKTYDVSDDRAYAITTDEFGNVYVTGGCLDTLSGRDYVTIKYDAAGNAQWVRKYNGPAVYYNDVACAIAVDADGNVYVTGLSSRGGAGNWPTYDYATVKYSSSGEQLWAARYDGPYAGGDEAKAVAVDELGNVYVTGKSYYGGVFEYATIKYSPTGQEMWVRRYTQGGDTYYGANDLALDKLGNVCVTGGSGGNYVTVKYDSDGNLPWAKAYDGPQGYHDVALALAIDDSNSLYITGRSATDSQGSNGDYATVKYDADGNQLWVQRYDGPGNGEDIAKDIAVDDSGNVFVTGTSYGGMVTGADYATIKYTQPVWTFLIFMNGDNNLEAAAINDINEMEVVGSNAKINIVVEVDRVPGRDGSNGDWTDTRRYYVTHDTDPSTIGSVRLDTLPQLGELNMGNPQTLIDFVNWGIDNFPAQHYAIILWDHGDGWYKKDGREVQEDFLFKGIGPDSTNNDNLTVSDGEWASALIQIRNHLGRNIELVGFDACLMQMWEVMDITDRYADYMVGSEEVEENAGWDYDQFLSALSDHPEMSIEQLGYRIARTAVDGSNQPTQSCVKLSRVSQLNAAMVDFSLQLSSCLGSATSRQIIQSIRSELHNQSHEFGLDPPDAHFEHVDLSEFADCVSDSARLPQDLILAALHVVTTVHDVVTYNATRDDYMWAHGIAVYYPQDPATYDARYNNLPIASATLWDEFSRGQSLLNRGDATGDGVVDVSDAVFLIEFIFNQGPMPVPLEAGDCNCDGTVDISDVVYLIQYIFASGPPPQCP